MEPPPMRSSGVSRLEGGREPGTWWSLTIHPPLHHSPQNACHSWGCWARTSKFWQTTANPPQKKKTPKYQGEMTWNVIFKNINCRISPFHLFRFVSGGFLVGASWRTQCHVPPYLVLMVPPNPDSRGLELFLASKSSIKDGTKNHSNGQLQ